ncbi:family 20 glycosylhydrolase [Streptomyces sp. TRM 70351]|uniref:family 20 glycosylhydrolase n=1 Tax=Streptomyces sp. TRM 70351 TaxID=3116552 RepID=UPI002E7B7BD5|nr:family 20 glycosylhydrolase [Streptomyces sp. TRM 70351]MEE1926693.1 family 20 glycosylhydrolase [Streptomyces sp. TRM 70351]
MDAVIPRPARRTPAAAGGTLPTAGPWRVRAADDRLTPVAGAVHALLGPHLGDRLLPLDRNDGAPGTVLTLGLALDDAPTAPHRDPVGVSPCGAARPPDQSYRLAVTGHGISCRAATAEGVFRAATTALQLIAASDGAIPYQEFTDAPHYAWRGLLVDPARGYLTPDELCRVIDLAALYKLNVLHLHLTDNEGWRLDLPAMPELTAPGNTGTGDTAPGSEDAPRDFYTAEDYRALQRYAAERFVTVVPEIDLPGHCAALRAALPELPPAPAPEGLTGRFPFVPPLDLADPATRAAVEAILTDVCRLTTGPFVHVGGDESFGMTPDSFALAVRELRALVRARGKRPLAWQESSRAGIEPGDVVQFWVDVPMMDLPDTQEELDRRPELLAAGHTLDLIRALKTFFAPADHDAARTVDGGGRVLLSPQSHLYLDRPYSPDVTPPRQGAAARLGFPAYRPRDVRHTAEWDPASHGIPEERIAGVEATLFGESVGGIDDLTTLLLPRLASVAETAWSGRAPRWEDHRTRVARHGRLWEERGLAYLASTEIPWT